MCQQLPCPKFHPSNIASVVWLQVLAEVAYLEGLPEDAAADQLRKKCPADADIDPQDVLAFLMVSTA